MQRTPLDSNDPPAVSRLKLEHQQKYAAIVPQRDLFMKNEAADLLLVLNKCSTAGGLLLDLSQCCYISSEGLGALVKLALWSQSPEGVPAVVVVSGDGHEEVLNLLRITGVDRTLGTMLYTDRVPAVQYLESLSTK